MKRYLLLFLAISIVTIVKSQTADYNAALNVAQNTIIEKFYKIDPNIEYKISSYDTESYNGRIMFHIFNLVPSGFILISGDKSATPVLGFSTESNYNKYDKNPAVEFWLDSYKKQINYNIDKQVTAKLETQNEWAKLDVPPSQYKIKNDYRSVEPLLRTNWDQGKYYNSFCPEDPAGTNGHVVVGCVATALGQLMNYFRYPLNGTSSYGYEHPNYGWLEVDFSQQTYDYDQMPIEPNEYNENIARLLYNIGVSVDMNYGPDGSGMWNHKGAYTLRTYFGYDESTTYLFRDSLPDDFDWKGTLVEHLNNKIPLYYAGWSDYDYISGHAFILDGYMDSTHYHINWGWGGSSNGYFTIDDLTVGSSDFTLLHEVIVNAVPVSPSTTCNQTKELNSLEGTIEDGSGPFEFYQNNSECDWLIAPQDSASNISFEIINLEMDNNDYIIVYDGEEDSDPIITTIFGDSDLETFESSSNKVLFRFVTDDDSVNNGWLISYQGNKPSYCNIISNISEPSGTISDGSNSHLYQENTYCFWYIEPEGAESIKITFTEIDIEPINDYVKIQDYDNQTVANISGNEIPEPIIVEGNKATISFKSNALNQYQGFSLYYETTISNFETNNTYKTTIYPNPVKSHLYIANSDSERIKIIRIYTLDGKLVRTLTPKQLINGNQINCSDLNKGIYLIEIDGTNIMTRSRFVKM